MRLRMVAEFVTLGQDAMEQVRSPRDPLSHEEEQGFDLVRGEAFQHGLGLQRIWAIVEREQHSGVDATADPRLWNDST